MGWIVPARPLLMRLDLSRAGPARWWRSTVEGTGGRGGGGCTELGMGDVEERGGHLRRRRRSGVAGSSVARRQAASGIGG
jgi:hypothetical protein